MVISNLLSIVPSPTAPTDAPDTELSICFSFIERERERERGRISLTNNKDGVQLGGVPMLLGKVGVDDRGNHNYGHH